MNHKRCSFSDTHLRCILIDFGFAPLLSLFPSFTFPALLLPPVDTCSSPGSICLSCVIQRQAALNQNHFRANCHSFPDPFWQSTSTPLLSTPHHSFHWSPGLLTRFFTSSGDNQFCVLCVRCSCLSK